MRSVMSHNFSRVPSANIPRSKFSRPHGLKTTFDAGYLVPVYVDEALPGDTFNVRMTAFARLATPLKPFMDNLYLTSFFFAVPIRLIWDNWQRFNGEQIDPGDSTDFLVPQVVSPASTGWTSQTLFDYMGIPTGIPLLSISAFWSRSYNLIYNEWFRDENLQDSVVVDRDDGPDTATDYVLLRRGKRHDYFTSALPWPQKGPSVPLPLTGDAKVTGVGKLNQTFPNGAQNVYETDGTGTTAYVNSASWGDGTANITWFGQEDPNNPGYPNIRADLSSVVAATINELRESFAIQRLYERDARGGTRYTEIIRAHFGVVSPDARLQRPEYLGGGRTAVNVNPVAQTTPTPAGGVTTPQGNLAAMGTLSAHGHGFVKSFTEHSIILGMICVDADLNYQQGLERMWSRRTRWDFYWPALSHLGEQAILNKEIYAQGPAVVNSSSEAIDELVFGYQERWAEYRYKNSLTTGKMRSQDPQSLDVWHLAQDFASLPQLNEEFIVSDPPMARVSAVPSEPDFIADFFFQDISARPMPMYSVPGLIDHF